MKIRAKLAAVAMVSTIVALSAPLAFAQTHSKPAGHPSALGIGVFTFMSGPGASYGMPGYDGAKVIINQINKKGGIDGVPINPSFVDEAQGTQNVIGAYRRLSDNKNNQLMLAALSSSDCLALAPVADELHMPMLAWNCDTYQLFEKHSYGYVFRANSNVIPEFLAYVIYFAQSHPHAKRIAIIGPDYAFGHDASKIIKAGLKRFAPNAKVVADLFPSLGSASYLTDVSRLLAAHPDAVFVNLWGGDLQTFVKQALPRGLFKNSQMVLTLGETVLQKTGQKFPPGVIVGMLGDGYWNSPTTQANKEAKAFITEYHKRYGSYPVFPAFKMANAIMVMKGAYHKAIKSNNGAWPTKKQVTQALSGITVKTLTGSLHIRKSDHDGLMDQEIGVTAKSHKYPFPVITKMSRYPATKITPPAGADPFKWIADLPNGFIHTLPKPGSYK